MGPRIVSIRLLHYFFITLLFTLAPVLFSSSDFSLMSHTVPADSLNELSAPADTTHLGFAGESILLWIPGSQKYYAWLRSCYSEVLDEMNTELKYDHKYNLVNISEKYKYLLEKFSNPIKNDINETEAVVRQEKNNVRRNDPCPCGSGIKYKKCCGK